MSTFTLLKSGIVVFAISLAIVTPLIALEYWRPDKVTGYQINPNQCVAGSMAFCATVYEDDSDTPIVALYGHFIENP